MNLIGDNPYRVLGVWAGANDREIIRQRTRFKAYLKVNKDIEADTDLSFLPNVNRSEETVQKAISSLEKTEQKIIHSLLWFTNLTPIDSTALKHLTNGNIDKAGEIWVKPSYQTTESIRKISALNNLSTLDLTVSYSENNGQDFSNFKEALSLKLQVLTFESMQILSDSFGDETFHLDTSNYQAIVKKFFNQLRKEIKSHDTLNSEVVTSLFRTMDSDIRQIAEQVFSGELSSVVESALRTAGEKRKDSPENANIAGKHLYSRSFEPLKKLESSLGRNNMTYQMLADKVAQELIECSISYYNHHTKGYEIDPGDDAMNLLNKAKSLAIGTMVKDRIKKNLPTIEEWQRNMVNRENLKVIESELTFINKKLDQSISGSKTTQRAQDLITSCKPKLSIVKDKLGAGSLEYIRISSDVVAVAQGMVVTEINNKQDVFKFLPRNPTHYEISSFNSDVKEAINVMESMRTLPKNSELARQFKNNLDTIYSLKQQTSSNSQSGCYIATMAYGSYEHPQVIKLRHFRDNTLSKSFWGRTFIKSYYSTSPIMVKYLRDFSSIHSIIRKVLDKFIKLIRY